MQRISLGGHASQVTLVVVLGRRRADEGGRKTFYSTLCYLSNFEPCEFTAYFR